MLIVDPVLPIGGELCIGKQFLMTIPGNPVLQPSFNFVGKLDEVSIALRSSN